jgi:hypothetical protein
MTENTEELDPRAVERERRRKRNLTLPKIGGTFVRREDGTIPVDDAGNPVPEPESVTAPPSGKSALARALYAKELREAAAGGVDNHNGVQAEAAFQQAHAAAAVPRSTRAQRQASTAPADDNTSPEG